MTQKLLVATKSVAYVNKGVQEGNNQDMKKGESIFLNMDKNESKSILTENLPLFYSNLAIIYANNHQYKKAFMQSKLAL